MLRCKRCAFGWPAEVDLHTCPTRGTLRINLTQLGLVCTTKGVKVSNSTRITSPPPLSSPSPPPMRPPPPRPSSPPPPAVTLQPSPSPPTPPAPRPPLPPSPRPSPPPLPQPPARSPQPPSPQPPSTALPPAPVLGPQPPITEVSATIAQAEVAIAYGHMRPADDAWSGSAAYEAAETDVVALVQRVDNSTDFVQETDADPADPSLDLRTGDVVDVTVTQAVDPSTPTRRRVLLEAAAGTRRTLQDLSSGLIVTPGGRGKLSITSFKKTSSNGGKDFIIGNQPYNLTSLTFLMHMCGKNLSYTRDAVNRMFFNRFATNNNYTLQRHHEVCSYNKLRFPPETNLVFGPVAVPCSGTVAVTSNTDNRATGAQYSYDFANRCGNDERYGLWELAKRWLQTNQPSIYANVRFYKRKLLLMSEAPACGFRGMANSGCGSSHCISWIRSTPSLTDDIWSKAGLPDATTIFQELGHNIGLNHAGRLYLAADSDGSSFTVGAYDDMTDPMGGGYPDATRMTAGPVCLSAPQAYKAGWASPIAGDESGTLSGDFELWDMAEGVNYFFNLPSMHLGDKNLIRIRMSATFSLTPNAAPNNRLLQQAYFISLRQRQSARGAFDHALRPVFDSRVAVHEYNGTASAKTDNPVVVTGLRQLLTAGIPTITQVFGSAAFNISRVWTSPALPDKYNNPSVKGGRLTVGVERFTTATGIARVRLCRTTRTQDSITVEDCTAGDFDYNCDGLPDSQQEFCDNLVNGSSGSRRRELETPEL
ncbi:hypothetical protein HYH02_009751 [Chlamydomonas schloesseri]|uniref:Peptidase M11 gametolysin domain-containing protein n=1 Tax=Chlamydomonas schloesseri TaxID=2026947 RepID=A0A835W634_9CHLO|nr:hypothetical protein HYH02_009751 [Chlamydomonas schloesseri]|eukprot:KAG2441957.1 hypothetical protein HYH02_009751 [Chlamydomonas schloesseri]